MPLQVTGPSPTHTHNITQEPRHSLECADLVRQVEVASSLRPQLLECDTLSDIEQRQLARRAVDRKRSHVGDDHGDSARAREGQRTLLDELRLAVLLTFGQHVF